ncbi:hypothetical protein PLESTB_001337900 [Pleodorina starrii]|uniref:Kinesin light chain n=1 Tax=Pleodorina starrii TaxID=330485 RepID=A0A9W6BVH5_9CHLO|nr:hypothetical protein PLESTB_001337900 [Pleodorina starrii]
MGCGASSGREPAKGRPAEQLLLPPDGKPLEEWEAEEVSAWFSTLVGDLQQYRSKLLPDEGCIVAQWTEQFLIDKEVKPADAMRLITYRNKALSKSRTRATAAAITGTEAAVGVPIGAASGGQAAAYCTAGTLAGTDQQDGGQGVNTITTTTSTTHVLLRTTQTVSSQQNSVGGQAPKRQSLLSLLTTGVKVARVAIEKLGPSLPFPGAEAANLVVALFDLVDAAIANHANLTELRQRAVALLDILAAYHEELANLRPPRYKGVVDDFKELLQGIIAHTRAYCERNCIMRLLTSSSDQEQYLGLVASLGTLSEQVMMLVAADSNARLQVVQKAVEESRQLLGRVAEYQDPAAAARELVSELGGLDAVLADDDKLRRVKLKLDVGAQVTIKVVESLLTSHLDQGPQRLIRHPDLRVFWMKQYASIVEVPWYDFWEQFPVQLKDNPAPPSLVEELSRMLSDEAARLAFERGVERGNKDCVSVWELKVAFREDEGLVPQVARLLPSNSSNSDSSSSNSGSDSRRKPTAAAAAAAGAPCSPGVTAAAAAAAAAPVRCQLPPRVSHYTGREEEAAAVVGHLLTRGSLVLLAPGGMGKSCLAIDAGWRLVQLGAAAGGALWVDLREASGKAEVEARFCASLGLQAEKADNMPRILAELRVLAGSTTRGGGADAGVGGGGDGGGGGGGGGGLAVAPPMRVLVVVDNAEDSLLHPDAAGALRGLLTRVLRELPTVRLLVTSRASLGLTSSGTTTTTTNNNNNNNSTSTTTTAGVQHPRDDPQLDGRQGGQLILEHSVGAINRDAATSLIRTVAADLTEAEAREVAAACKCVPLLLCLVAEALVAGRLTLEDLARLQAVGAGAAEGTEATSSTVRVVLGSLKRQHQQAAAQLSVFPSTFDEEGAAAMWTTSAPQAHALLAVLHRYSVVQRSSGQQYVMHMVVRQQAAAVGRQLDPELQSGVEGRFGTWMLGLLREWAAMYRTAQEWRLAMAIARDHQPDMSKLLELLTAAPDPGPEAGAAPAAAASAEQQQQQAPQRANSAAAPAPVVTAAIPTATSASFWDPATVAAAFTDDLRQLLEGLGLLPRLEAPCLALLGRLGASVDGDAQQGALRPAGDAAAATAATAVASAAQPQPNAAQPRCSLPDPNQPGAQSASRLQTHTQQPLAVASVLFMLAWVRVRGGRQYKEAEEHARRSWALRLAALGPEHPDTVTSQYILAAALGYLRRYGEAEELNRQVLERQLQLLGEMHPDTAYSINGLAVCVDKQGRFAEAEAMYRRALRIRQQVLGDKHPATAGSLNNLAGSIYFQGRRAEAEELYRQALELRRQVLGEEHPDTVATLANLTNCLHDQARFAEAEPLLRQCLELRRRLLGEDHPDAVQSLCNLAACVYGQIDREPEAERLYRQAVRISVRTLGRGHATTRSRLVSLRNCVEAQGRSFDEEAELLGLLEESGSIRGAAG